MNAISRFGILDDAKKAVEDREGTYGTPAANFERQAKLAQVILQSKLRPGTEISAADMVMLNAIAIKGARWIESPDHVDTAIDVAGYAALMCEVV
jgi:hypothetical protein